MTVVYCSGCDFWCLSEEFHTSAEGANRQFSCVWGRFRLFCIYLRLHVFSPCTPASSHTCQKACHRLLQPVLGVNVNGCLYMWWSLHWSEVWPAFRPMTAAIETPEQGSENEQTGNLDAVKESWKKGLQGCGRWKATFENENLNETSLGERRFIRILRWLFKLPG